MQEEALVMSVGIEKRWIVLQIPTVDRRLNLPFLVMNMGYELAVIFVFPIMVYSRNMSLHYVKSEGG